MKNKYQHFDLYDYPNKIVNILMYFQIPEVESLIGWLSDEPFNIDPSKLFPSQKLAKK